MVAQYPVTNAHKLQSQRSNPFLIIILEFGVWTSLYIKSLPSWLPISKSQFAPNPIQPLEFKIHETILLQNKIIQIVTTITSTTKLTTVTCIWISLFIKSQCKKMLANYSCASVARCWWCLLCCCCNVGNKACHYRAWWQKARARWARWWRLSKNKDKDNADKVV